MAKTRNYAGLSIFLLKIIAILSMLACHVLIVFEGRFANNTESFLFYFGRLAFPIFAFSIANGWNKTHNRFIYTLRILIMAIISQIPFAVCLKGVEFTNVYKTFFSANLNIGFTFLLACGCLAVYSLLRKIDFPILIALICAILPALAFEHLTPFHVDYGYRGVALILVMFAFLNDRPMMFLSSGVILAWMSAQVSLAAITVRTDVWLSYLVALILIMLYNGNRGARAKYLFHIFYPLHMIILILLKMYLV
ncbi:MAG: hypothetical protein IIV97_02305 [Oscillospiraceae bacterium]|nr:hypothetical protein [Oscillospiraceae bacterium]